MITSRQYINIHWQITVNNLNNEEKYMPIDGYFEHRVSKKATNKTVNN